MDTPENFTNIYLRNKLSDVKKDHSLMVLSPEVSEIVLAKKTIS